ncbi:ATP-binding protein [Burkholderia sp. WP9]|uniref:ATP-binding protein n=1 Tax=Burkholderia sp. WP9 TaxID=1500263 RepID=UPI000B83C14C
MFEMFAQRRPTGPSNGLGIGLALVREIAEAHGGSVRLAPAAPGKGARFVLEVPHPARPADAASAIALIPRAPSAVGRKALVVDDNADAANGVAALQR